MKNGAEKKEKENERVKKSVWMRERLEEMGGEKEEKKEEKKRLKKKT